MEAFLKRANEADDLLSKLTKRVEALESQGGSSSSAAVPAGMVLVDPSQELMTEPARTKLRAMVKKLKDTCDSTKAENERLKKQLAAAKKEINQLKSGGSSAGVTPEQAKLLQSFKNYVNPMQKVTESLKKWRADVVALTEERDALKKQVEEKAAGGGVNNDQINLIREKLIRVRAEVVKYMEKQGEIVEAVGAPSGPTLVKQTMETIKDLKYYTVTGDLAELKKEWAEAELGELDDEDFQLYLNRKVRVIEIEEDDDTINVRFDNHDTQWFPVGCLYDEVEGAAPTVTVTSTGPTKVQMTMDTIKERKYYFVTEDMTALKAAWEEAELGELDDEDFQLYLGRKVYAIDLEEDDDTMNVRFDNHDTQWFPVCCLYEEVEAPAQAAAPVSSGPTLTQMTPSTIKERKYYYVTKDMAELKTAWFEAELGELDDDDFQLYLGRKVYAIDIEEDDDTMNVRFDNHDTQWFPISTLYTDEVVVPSVNGSRTMLTMDTIKERQYYFVTKDMAELKSKWEAAELGELDDEDFEKYLGRKVYAVDLEEDDDTMNVRFDNHDTQWFPVESLYKD